MTIEVADTGIGVPGQEMGLVFRELGRAGNARALPGSGLGLPLVRTIAERHGGSVGMTSREGVGTRVWVVLPVRARQERPELDDRAPRFIVVSHDCDRLGRF